MLVARPVRLMAERQRRANLLELPAREAARGQGWIAVTPLELAGDVKGAERPDLILR